jgi:hypothetical protein
VRSPTLGNFEGLTSGDTVEVFSDVTVCWDGSDGDGEIVGWESKIDNEPVWRFHEGSEKCRSFDDLSPGLHLISLRAIDDAGAKSTSIFRIRVYSNFAPVTTIDVATIRAVLPRPWLGDSLVVGPGLSEPDTLPLGSTAEMCWSSTDLDGPVTKWNWRFGAIGRVELTSCVNTDTTGAPDPGAPNIPTRQVLSVTDDGLGLAFFVKGIDIYNNVEQKPDSVYMYVNFQPTVAFTQLPDTTRILTGAPVNFWFQGGDKDSDPDGLRYRWKFSLDVSGQQPVSLNPDSLFVRRAFTPSEVGHHTLSVWAQDPSGSVRESAPAVVGFTVVQPRQEPGAVSGEVRP